jgi:quercetin dioxygenase-like cupin family protein
MDSGSQEGEREPKGKSGMQENELYGRVLDLVELVRYQEDAIVSRIVTKAAKGSVTMFAFDRGQELSEHTAPFDALVQVVDGEAEIRVSGEPHLLQRVQGIVMPANQPHSVKAVAKFKMILTMLKT